MGVSRDEILHGNIFKGLLKLAIPLIFLNIINTLYGLVDTFFVGKIGELQVGAVSLVSPLTNCGIAFASGLSAAGIAMISRALGKNQDDKARELATHLIVLAVILGITITTICIVFRNPILNWLNTPKDIYEDTYAYFIGVSFDYTCLFILTMFQAIRQSCGDSKSGAKVNMISSVLNGMLDPLFIFVFHMGTFGAALATVLSKVIMCPFALYSLFNRENLVYVSLKENKLQLRIMKKIIVIAIPASVGQLLSSFGFVLMSREIVSYGSIIMSGYGVGNSISSIFYIPINSIGSALPTYIGQNLGADNTERAKECYKTSLKLVAIMSVIVIALGFLTGRFLVSVFIKNASPQLIDVSLEYAYYSISTAFFMGWFYCLCGVFDGSTNTRISMILSTCRILVIRMPIVYLLARFTSLGYTGIWVSMILSNLIICTIGQIIYSRFSWEKTKFSLD